ncbi:uncharacterized protein [Magallana gigas]|uniref:uncharacterized protein n=1 Tax=Magallana gigas TaxID=29159 RepID=UPI003341E2F0
MSNLTVFAFRMTLPREMYSVFVFGLTLTSLVEWSSQHGLLLSPPQRGSLWRYGYDTPPNYDDNGLFCGGLEEYIKTGGKCGVCGDAYSGPREHEAGGKYAKGIIVEQLPAESTEMKTTIQITSYHKGFFEFRICPHNDIRRPVAQECLDEHLMIIKEGSPESSYTRFYPSNPKVTGKDKYHLTLLIPRGMRCEQCVLQWTYNTGNSWGTDKNGTSCLGCGLQEVFKNCADISIGGTPSVETAQAALIKSEIKEDKTKLQHEIKSGLFHEVRKAIENTKAAKHVQHPQPQSIQKISSPTPVFSTKTYTSGVPQTTFSAKSLVQNRNLFMPVGGLTFLSQIKNRLAKQLSWLKQVPFHHASLLSDQTPDNRFTLASKIKFMPDNTKNQEYRTTAMASNLSPKIRYHMGPQSSFNLYTNPSLSFFESGGHTARVSRPDVNPTVAYKIMSPVTTTKVTKAPTQRPTEASLPTTTDPLDVSQWGEETVTKLPKKYQSYFRKYREAKSTLDVLERNPKKVLSMSKYRRYRKRKNGQNRLKNSLERDVKRWSSRLEKIAKKLHQ